MVSNLDKRPRKEINGRAHIKYDDYWIRFYEPPPDSYRARLELIDALTRRAFHHSEPGINTPGSRLELARAHWERQSDPDKQRVNAAMLAGALFNRATDIFNSVVEMEAKGIKISRHNELLRQCGRYLQEALELGKYVRHISGEEGVDEFLGEPLKIFTLPIKDYYESRYIKIAQAMRTIDEIIERMIEVFGRIPRFPDVAPRLKEYGETAKRFTEIMKSDPDFFTIWPEFVVFRDRIMAYVPESREYSSEQFGDPEYLRACKLLTGGCDLIYHVSSVRVPMTKSSRAYLEHLDAFHATPSGA